MRSLSYFLFADSELIMVLLLSLAAVFLIFAGSRFLPDHKASAPGKSPLPFVRSSETNVFSRNDLRNLLVLTSVTAIFTLWQLGSTVFPVTTWQPSATGQSFILELTEETEFSAVHAIYGEGDNNALSSGYQLGFHDILLEGSEDGVSWKEICVLDEDDIYRWQVTGGPWNYRYICVTSSNERDTITEIGFCSADGTHFLPVSVSEDAHEDSAYPASLVIDEQDTLVLSPTYMNESFFDEVYHPRNAWEVAEGQDMYATAHPLLGTNIMALFIHLFGMSPLVWRLPGALFGIMIVPLIYCILKMLFHKSSPALIGGILSAADFMRLTTSRIGTLEPYSVFFILLMYAFMIRYLQTSFYDTPLKKQFVYLTLCGISCGLAIATKWTGLYSCAGLAVLLFASFIPRWKEYRKAEEFLEAPGEKTPEQIAEAQRVTQWCLTYILETILFCFFAFVLIPVVIYWLSYLPDRVWKGDSWSIANVWKQNLYMYDYHSGLTAEHPYESRWYQWLLDLRPVWYHISKEASGVRHTIACFSNPFLTWAGIPAVIFTGVCGVMERDKKALIILTGVLSALLPWMFISRCQFAYHFYPTSVFMIMAVAYMCCRMSDLNGFWKSIVTVYLVSYVLLFLVYLPVTSGFGTNIEYIRLLEKLPGWYFG